MFSDIRRQRREFEISGSDNVFKSAADLSVSAEVVPICSCGNIMDEYGREGRLWEVRRDQESYLNEICAVLRTGECVSLSEGECVHMCDHACVCAAVGPDF